MHTWSGDIYQLTEIRDAVYYDLNEKFEEVIISQAVEAGFVVNALFAAGTVLSIGKDTGFV